MGIDILAKTATAILAAVVFLGMIAVVGGQQSLLPTVMHMFHTVVVLVLLITFIINLPRIIRALIKN